ncbi:beta-trefoil DNA-binding domain-containing protein [Sporodiniella umbellata]|nr:beta-trefoil DNA-binding domain-containing protein [Sporodiniella umbellata]
MGFEEQDDPPLQSLVQNYLLQKHQNCIPGEKTVTILTSRVAQKSYGTEKRFLCPPPATVLKGTSWWTADKIADKSSPNGFQSQPTALQSPKLTIQISGETIQQSGTIEWQTLPNTDKKLANDHQKNFGRCISKQLFINDADEKRKRVEVLASIQLANGLSLGTFQSKGIKVISKPSKKRQSVKNMELCIHHGTTISLFNRIRSQTVSTKYLGVSTNQLDNSNGTCFVSRTGTWDPFVIWIVDTSCTSENVNRPKNNPNNPDYPPSPAIALQSYSPLAIHYNQPVVLQCVTTGLVSPVMIIRKVDKQSLVLGGNSVDQRLHQSLGGECSDETLGDPVSQLHKVAFQIVQDPSFHQNSTPHEDPTHRWKIPLSSHPVTYLACLNDVVGMHKTTSTRHLVPQCQEQPPAEPWNDIMPKEPLRRMSTAEAKGRRGSLAKSTNPLVDGLEGSCWTEDVSDAAVWTVVGTDSTSYTFWTPPDRKISSIPSFPTVHQVTQQGDHLVLTGENFSQNLEVWFGDVKSLQTDHISGETVHCKIPVMTHSPTIQQDEVGNKKVPLLFVRSNGTIHRTNFYHTL